MFYQEEECWVAFAELLQCYMWVLAAWRKGEQEDKPVVESTGVWDPPVDLDAFVLSEDEVSQVRNLL